MVSSLYCRAIRSGALLGLAVATLLAGGWPARVAAQQGGGGGEVAENDENFTVVLLPDTQFYSEKHPDTYVAQTLWIRKRAQPDNIRFAIHLGDIVQNANTEQEWKNAHAAMRLLDGVVPYSVAPGNHDLDKIDGKLARKSSLYNKYFPFTRFQDRSWYGGHLGETNDNNYCYFQGAGMDFMVVSLEFAPTDETLQWANRVVADHPRHRVIVATHCYMRPNGRDTSCAQSVNLAGNSGQQIWEKFVRKHANIFLVVSGHVLGVGLQQSTNDAGGTVYEMLTDYQGLPNGGNGWLRTLRFIPRENKIQVEVYSPLLDTYNEAPDQALTLPYEMSRLRKKAG